jgi:hypothetical protein
MLLHNDIGDHAMKKKQKRPFSTCRFRISHERGLECAEVMQWREQVKGLGKLNSTLEEVARLAAAAPRCINHHGMRRDKDVFASLQAVCAWNSISARRPS